MCSIFDLTTNIFDAVQFNKSIVFNDFRTDDNINSICSIHKASLILCSIGINIDAIGDEKSIFINVFNDTPLVEAAEIVKERLLEQKFNNIKQNIKSDIIVLYEPLLPINELKQMVDDLLSKYNYPVFIFTDDKIPGLIHGIAKNNREMDVKELAETAESLFLKCIAYSNELNIVAQKVNFEEIKENLLCAYENKLNNDFEAFVKTNEMIMKSY